MKEIKFFELKSGKKPFNEWLTRLKSKQDRARICRRVDRLAAGNYGDHKWISQDLYELRLLLDQVIVFTLLSRKMK